MSVHPGFGGGWREETEGLQPTNQKLTTVSDLWMMNVERSVTYSSLQLQQPRGFRWKCSSGVRSVSHMHTLCCGSCKSEECKQIQESARQGRGRKFRQILPQSALQHPESSSRVGWSLNSDQIPVLFCVLFPSACVAGRWKGCAAEGCGSFDMPHYATLLSTGNGCLVSLWKYR